MSRSKDRSSGGNIFVFRTHDIPIPSSPVVNTVIRSRRLVRRLQKADLRDSPLSTVSLPGTLEDARGCVPLTICDARERLPLPKIGFTAEDMLQFEIRGDCMETGMELLRLEQRGVDG